MPALFQRNGLPQHKISEAMSVFVPRVALNEFELSHRLSWNKIQIVGYFSREKKINLTQWKKSVTFQTCCEQEREVKTCFRDKKNLAELSSIFDIKIFRERQNKKKGKITKISPPRSFLNKPFLRVPRANKNQHSLRRGLKSCL